MFRVAHVVLTSAVAISSITGVREVDHSMITTSSSMYGSFIGQRDRC